MADFNDVISSNVLVLVDFHAEWCGPCKMVAPILKEIKSEFKDELRIIKIDVDKNPTISAKYRIQGVPTMMLFKSGKQLWRQSGVVPKANLSQLIRQHLSQ